MVKRVAGHGAVAPVSGAGLVVHGAAASPTSAADMVGSHGIAASVSIVGKAETF